VLFGRDLLSEAAKEERLGHMIALVLAALSGRSAALLDVPRVRRTRAPSPQIV
jgi:hypothetical protein